MRLVVNPGDVHAAAVALSLVAGRLDDAVATFTAATAREAPDLGRDAMDATTRSAAAAAQATDVIVGDIRTLARALRELAHVYAELDATAMPAPP